MKKKLLVVLAVGGSIFAAAGLLLAHHSATGYDREREITLQGTVTEFRLTNPHPLLYFTAKDETGNVEEWFAESGSPPNRWYNDGWKANALKPGTPITITGNPSKDDRKRLMLRKMVAPNGLVWPKADAASAPYPQ